VKAGKEKDHENQLFIEKTSGQFRFEIRHMPRFTFFLFKFTFRQLNKKMNLSLNKATICLVRIVKPHTHIQCTALMTAVVFTFGSRGKDHHFSGSRSLDIQFLANIQNIK